MNLKLFKIISTSVLLIGGLGVKAVEGAEKIRVIYGPLDFSVAVESLEVYAESGEIKQDLKLYTKYLNEAQQEQLRQLLDKKWQFNQLIVSNLTNTSLGKDLLQELGYVIKVDQSTNGLYALRGAMIEAAKNPAGFSIIDVIRKFPLESIYVDAELLLKLQNELVVSNKYRQAVVQAIAAEAEKQAKANPLNNPSQLADLRQAGPLSITKETIKVTKKTIRQTHKGLVGSYSFEADVYFPQNSTQPAPLIVISHGFGSLKQNFTKLAEHLASHGFVVAVPEHVGSDLRYRQELLEGKLSTALSPIEYLDRPLDITYLLDELETLVAENSKWKQRVNLDKVGLIGDSLGATTVLSLAGAEINTVRLQQECARDEVTLSAAILLQCQGSYLPPLNIPLKDPRIKAVISAHPLTSAIFGPEGLSEITIPTMIVAGSDDIVTPVIQEQIHPFIWLETAEKYLVLYTPGTHFTSSEPPDTYKADYIPSKLIGENRQLGSAYFRGLSVAFMKAYLDDLSEYLPYLTAAYGEEFSQEELEIYQIQSLTPNQLETAYGDTLPEAIIPPPVIIKSAPREQPILTEIKENGVVKIAMRRDVVPFGYLDKEGQWTGYCSQLTDALSTYLEKQLELSFTPEIIKLQSNEQNRFDLVTNNTVYLECGPNPIQDNVTGVAFSVPFFITGTYFLIHNSQEINPNQALTNVKIGVFQNTPNELLVKEKYPDAELVYFDSIEGKKQGFESLLNNQIDTLVDDSILLLGNIREQGLSLEEYQLVPKIPLQCNYYGLIIPNDDPEWARMINRFLESELAQEIYQQSFPKQINAYQRFDLNYCLNIESGQ